MNQLDTHAIPASNSTATDVADEDAEPLQNQSFSVIVPTYNEVHAIVSTIEELHDVLGKTGTEYEVIIVDDGSQDGTAELLKPRTDIRVVTHSINRGYGAALKTGIRRARHPLIVITDADGTYPNSRIPDLLALAEDVEMVVGARTGANVTYSPIRRIPKWFLRHFAQWMARQHIPDLNSGLRIFRKSVAERFLHILPNTFSFTTTITLAMLTNGYTVHFEPIDYHARIGQSKIQPIRDTLRFFQLILRTGLYFAPLRVFLPIAATFFLLFLGTLYQDVFIRQDLTERTLILFVTATQLGMFALLADMIDKRM